MVRTGKRAATLTAMLEESGLTPAPRPDPPTLDGLPRDVAEECIGLYRALGGLQPSPHFRPGQWDLAFEDFVVELDEELHFNRYRASTLEASWATSLPWRDDYQAFCRLHETECLEAGSWGKRWTNPSAARMFAGGMPGDLAAGAPRWKQRAIYDAIKDAAAAHGFAVPVARISTHDEIDGVDVETFLRRGGSKEAEKLRELVEARVVYQGRN